MNDENQTKEALCDCGLPQEECDSVYKTGGGFVAVPGSLAGLFSGSYDDAQDEKEERRDAVATLGRTLENLSESAAILSRLIENEY